MSQHDDGPRVGRSETFGAADRVRRRGEYRQIQSRGLKVHSRRFLWMVYPSLVESSGARLGIVVTKKIGSAVRRNRIKRVLREVFRRNRELFPSGSDLVVVAKKGLDPDAIGYHDVLDEIRGARHNLARAARKAAQVRASEPKQPEASEALEEPPS
jgi:ribonuclease P protein component